MLPNSAHAIRGISFLGIDSQQFECPDRINIIRP